MQSVHPWIKFFLMIYNLISVKSVSALNGNDGNNNNNSTSMVFGRIPWHVVSNNESNEIIKLSCHDPNFYPFNNLSQVYKVAWILPRKALTHQLQPGDKLQGWQVSDDGSVLKIEINKLNENVYFDGIYKCAVLAYLQTNNSLIRWYYLNWAVNYYSDLTMLQGATFIQSYSRNIKICLWTCAIILITAIGLYLLKLFQYKSVEEMDNSSDDTNTQINPGSKCINYYSHTEIDYI